jgi:maleate isomerase
MVVALPFDTDGGFGTRARIGLIVLETDQTIEAEARRLRLEGVDWYHARIANDAEVTADTLTSMEQRLPQTAALLPTAFEFDAIGYACTSAATLIGEARVTNAIQTAHPGVPCTTPITAAVDAFRALDVGRLAVVTPYSAMVTAPIVDHFESAGLSVAAVGSFLESNDLVVARITEESIAEAVRQIAADGACDAVFVSCTSLRTFGVIELLEAELDLRVVSSNLALLWRLLRLSGVDDEVTGLGSLFRLQV